MAGQVAVIGSGVSGLVAAHVLGRQRHVTIFEADSRPGGHAHTHDVRLADGRTVCVDSGFIVHNDRTYPTLQRLFGELDIATQATDMSMSVVSERTGWQYAGGQGIRSIFADPRTSARPAFLRMLWEVKRFHRAARVLLADSDTDSLVTFGDWLTDLRFSGGFLEHFARPLVAAVWSCAPDDALRYPARSLLTFLDHHGMLTVTGSPTWRTVSGGSRTYVRKVLQVPGIELRTSDRVQEVVRHGEHVTVRTEHGEHDFAHVVVATHPAVALGLLSSPTTAQVEVLGALKYSHNPAQLHTDDRVLPTAKAARASWNYRLPHDDRAGVLVTYDLTRLMRLPSPDGRRMLVTLGGADRIDAARVITNLDYEHPLYTASFVTAQRRLPEISDDRIAFAGAYHGWGFHEDGALSGLRAAERLGASW